MRPVFTSVLARGEVFPLDTNDGVPKFVVEDFQAAGPIAKPKSSSMHTKCERRMYTNNQ